MLASIVFRALQAGLAVGLIVALAHQLWTVPLIRQAETYEQAAESGSTPQRHAQPGSTLVTLDRAAGARAVDSLTRRTTECGCSSAGSSPPLPWP